MKKNKSSDQTVELLVRYLTGMADEAERTEALKWIRNSQENKRYFNELRQVYEASKTIQTDTSYNPDLSLERVKARHYRNLIESIQIENRENARFFRLEMMKYAALILFIVSLGIAGIRFTKNRSAVNEPQVWNTLEAPFGSRTHLTLADGTSVWLNAGSQLKYSSRFGKKDRKVFLEGEGYFHVAKDQKRQFIVSTSYLDIKVYGTQFNVKAYPDENTIQTTLVEGSVMIEDRVDLWAKRHRITLKPNQTATYYIQESKAVVKSKNDQPAGIQMFPEKKMTLLPHVNPTVYTSWKDSRWLIEAETLASLAVKLERRYNVKIVIKSPELQNYRFSGTLKDETLEQVLNLIKLSAPIQYTIENNVVSLDENRSFKNSYDEMLMKKGKEN
jgi:transmembrane sensor